MISILLAIKNEQKNLYSFLDYIRKQSFQNFEVIIIDNSENCKSLNFLKNYNGIKRLRVFKLNKNYNILNKRGAQINQAFCQSKGEVIFYPDADMFCSINLLNEINDKMKFSQSLNVREKILAKNIYGKFRNFERYFYENTVIDAPRVVKRKTFIEIKGFDQNLHFGADDWDIAKKLKNKKIKTKLTKNFVFHNEMGLNFAKILKKKFYYSNKFKLYIKKWGKHDEDIKKQFSFFYRFFGIFFEDKKKIPYLFSNLNLYTIFFINKIFVGLFYLFRREK